MDPSLSLGISEKTPEIPVVLFLCRHPAHLRCYNSCASHSLYSCSPMEARVDDLPEKPEKKRKLRKSQKPSPENSSGLSRRDFLKISGVGAAAPLVARAGALVAEAEESTVAIQGPGKVPV